MKSFVNLVIFDFDGVIINSGSDIANAVRNALYRFKQPLMSKEEIIKHIGHGSEELIRKCFPHFNDEQIKAAHEYYKQYYRDNAVNETRLYPQVENVLQRLKHLNKRVALVTNKSEEITLKILSFLNIDQYFDMVLGPESLIQKKPDPEGILKVLTSFKITSSQAIMVGDSWVDVKAGKAAKVLTCGVSYGLGNFEDLLEASPDYIIEDLAQLFDCIE